MRISIFAIALCMLGASVQAEEEKQTRQVFLRPGVLSVEVMHNGKPVKLMRDQNLKNHIVKFFRPTYRGKIQPMHPFAPHAVETIGEWEMIEYLQQKSAGDDSLMIIDSRTPDWVKRGTIPTAVNIPFTEFKTSERAMEIMEDQFNVTIADTWDFSYAKTLVMFCNGIWCPQSPTAIRKLLSMGYPAAKIKYFRGGMQNWSSLGLTVVYPEKK
ncbi:MAG: rhodanese-like domain-containing protein [Gammaproteobacteria bacterium]|nr:rhodanese-like domain-containing protein [Gammaproteobacteria bacterium]